MHAFSRPHVILATKALVHLFVALFVMMIMLFVPAGTFDYVDAWLYLGIVILGAAAIGIYLLFTNPHLLDRRMALKEQERDQAWIVGLGMIFYAATFVMSGVDHRYGWSNVPFDAVVTADVLLLLSYLVFTIVMRQNRYASRVIEVVEGQRLVADGLYAVVRHPMYLAALAMFLSTPVALGSWWALIPALPMIAIIMARIRNEEEFLRRKLPGYVAYIQRTRYRLIPGVW